MTEQDLRQQVRRKNPFTVPEEYFEGLTQQIMTAVCSGQLTAKKAGFTALKRIASVAACVFVAVVGVFFLFDKLKSHDNLLGVQDMEIDRYMGDMNDYAMFDNGDMYACFDDNNE